ncbi:MAG: isoprenylcysteine carboxylmethyltransferase family protein [Clostridia bacterium]|nr:isoprenylcysteine carboxylmethyltransferase family protein [Clostridia bacterium]
MKLRLLGQTCAKFGAGLVIIGLLLFLPAGTLAYANGWLLLGLFFVPMLLLGTVLFVKAPELLKKRLSTKEKQSTQKRVVALSGLMFAAGFIAAGLDFRFGWTHLPLWLVIGAAALFLVGYTLYAEVMRENAYLSRTVEVQQGQRVIDTGLYGVVRHPMYAATLLLFLSMPLVLGSLVSFVIFLAYPLLIARRIVSEEALLRQQLSGYSEYCAKVRWRLIPLVW